MNEEFGVDLQVIDVLSHCFLAGHGKIEVESRLVEDLYIDSMGLVEVVMALNELFEIDLPEKDISEWRSVADICAAVRRYK
ncbi:phosphopantetheine-binding protein [Pseudomonas sp. QTF5]|uniref:phosphopantetheine-binding protein n=1 Tax=Pseudomonas sp. QTF5 TaxID=1435425 RepID=UPI002115A5BF|nr:phosphopantetheine-binding protein [Pseudomonas sp. QTF5]